MINIDQWFPLGKPQTIEGSPVDVGQSTVILDRMAHTAN